MEYWRSMDSEGVHMIDNYRGGYFKALLDMRTTLERNQFWIGVKSVKKGAETDDFFPHHAAFIAADDR